MKKQARKIEFNKELTEVSLYYLRLAKKAAIEEWKKMFITTKTGGNSDNSSFKV